MREDLDDRSTTRETIEATSAVAPATAAAAAEPTAATGKPAVVEEVLIEEVSIDGMCGVY